MNEAWIIKYRDGKMVGHAGQVASAVKEARKYPSEQAAVVTTGILNKGLNKSHLGFAHVEHIRLKENVL